MLPKTKRQKMDNADEKAEKKNPFGVVREDPLWGDENWHRGFDAALDRTRHRIVEYGGDTNGNIPLQVVLDALND